MALTEQLFLSPAAAIQVFGEFADSVALQNNCYCRRVSSIDGNAEVPEGWQAVELVGAKQHLGVAALGLLRAACRAHQLDAPDTWLRARAKAWRYRLRGQIQRATSAKSVRPYLDRLPHLGVHHLFHEPSQSWVSLSLFCLLVVLLPETPPTTPARPEEASPPGAHNLLSMASEDVDMEDATLDSAGILFSQEYASARAAGDLQLPEAMEVDDDLPAALRHALGLEEAPPVSGQAPGKLTLWLVVDTNVLVSRLQLIMRVLDEMRLKDEQARTHLWAASPAAWLHLVLVVPYAVICELDRLKMRTGSDAARLTGQQARQAIHFLETRVDNNCVRLQPQRSFVEARTYYEKLNTGLHAPADDDILRCALFYQNLATEQARHGGDRHIAWLVTEDAQMRVKASTLLQPGTARRSREALLKADQLAEQAWQSATGGQPPPGRPYPAPMPLDAHSPLRHAPALAPASPAGASPAVAAAASPGSHGSASARQLPHSPPGQANLRDGMHSAALQLQACEAAVDLDWRQVAKQVLEQAQGTLPPLMQLQYFEALSSDCFAEDAPQEVCNFATLRDTLEHLRRDWSNAFHGKLCRGESCNLALSRFVTPLETLRRVSPRSSPQPRVVRAAAAALNDLLQAWPPPPTAGAVQPGAPSAAAAREALLSGREEAASLLCSCDAALASQPAGGRARTQRYATAALPSVDRQHEAAAPRLANGAVRSTQLASAERHLQSPAVAQLHSGSSHSPLLARQAASPGAPASPSAAAHSMMLAGHAAPHVPGVACAAGAAGGPLHASAGALQNLQPPA